jgi:hypothetical protein
MRLLRSRLQDSLRNSQSTARREGHRCGAAPAVVTLSLGGSARADGVRLTMGRFVVARA